MTSSYYGDIETNLGIGSVFDLVKDHNDAVSKTLEYHLFSKTKTHYQGLKNSLFSLKDYLLQQHITTMKLKPNNILYKKMASGRSRLYIIDNIGNSDFIPICNYNSYFAKIKILRKWKRFEARILNTYKHNEVLRRMFTSSCR